MILMKIYLYMYFLIFVSSGFAQDERFFRQFFSAGQQKNNSENNVKQKTVKYHTASPFYFFDLNDDGKNESFVLEKRESSDWINIHNSDGGLIGSFNLEAKGIDSHIYKINVRKLSASKDATKVLILHFYEGLVGHVDIKSTSRVYFLTIDKNDLKSIGLYRGPAIWDESTKKNHYHQRMYVPFLYDYNLDGIKEIAVKHQYITKIFFYTGKGSWLEL